MILGLLVWLVLPSGAATAAEPPLVKPLRQTTYELLDDSDTLTVRIPATLRAGVATDLTAEVIEVARGQVHEGTLTSAFTASVEGETGKSGGPALQLTISSPGLRTATYTVLLAIRKAGATPEEEQLEVELSHPAATLQAPSSIVVERVLPWTFIGKPQVRTTTVPLKETSNRSRISKITIVQIDQAKIGARPIQGRLLFEDVKPVGPNGLGRTDYALEGDFPIGTATGTVQVDAPQLAAPVPVTFEVRTRRDPFLIVPVALLGLLFGYLTRVYLQRRIDKETALLQAQELLATIDRELDRRRDANFQADARAIRTRLRDALDSMTAKPGEITATVNQANTDLTTALNRLSEARKAAQTEIDGLVQVLRSKGVMQPPFARQAIERALDQLAKINALLEADDVTNARTRLAEATQELVDALTGGATRWLAAARPLLTFRAPDDTPLPSELAARTTALAQAATRALESLTQADDPTPARLLEQTRAAHLPITTILDELRGVSPIAESVATTLERSPTWTAAELEAVRAKATPFAEELEAFSGQPDRRSSQQLVDSFRALLDALQKAILAHVSGDPTPVDELVKAGRYQDAAAKAVELDRKQRSGRPLGPGVATPSVPVGSPYRPSLRLLEQELEAPGFAPTVHYVRDRPPSLAQRQEETLRSLLVAKLAQSALLWAVLLVLAYVFYADRFTGTATDLAAVFFWAYAIDVTVSAVLTVAKGYTPATKSP